MKNAIEGRQIQIVHASKAHLRAFLKELGGTPTNFDDEVKLREKIVATGWEKDFIVVSDAEPEPVAAKKGEKVVTEPMVNLTIHIQEIAGGKRPVFVAVNGRGLLIPRNQKCDVKLRYLEVLTNAVETKYIFDEEAKVNVPQDMPSYPHQVHKMPSDEAIQAWYAYEAEQEAKQRARDEATSRKAA